jgi:hypothetical protein
MSYYAEILHGNVAFRPCRVITFSLGFSLRSVSQKVEIAGFGTEGSNERLLRRRQVKGWSLNHSV